MKFSTFVITIERSKDRYDVVDKHMKKNNIRFIKFVGVDGHDLDNEKVKDVTTQICNKICTRSIIGCAMSHILLWRYISTLDIDYALVLEDDILLDYEEFSRLRNNLEILLETYPLLLLYGVGSGYKNSYVLSDVYKIIEYNYCYSHACYLIKKSTADYLYNYYLMNKISYHIDFTDNNALYEANKNIGVLRPNIADNIGGDKSTMTSSSYILKFLSPSFYYSLTFPILRIYKLIVSFITIILVLLVVILLLLKITSKLVWFIMLLLLMLTTKFSV